MAEAERRARAHGCRKVAVISTPSPNANLNPATSPTPNPTPAPLTKVAVISGVGARGYYRKLGYELRGEGAYFIRTTPTLYNPNPNLTTP